MIEIDADDQGAVRVERVGRVEASAHAHLENDDIGVVTTKHSQRRDERRLEIRQRDRAKGARDVLEYLDELAIGRIDAVDANALVEPPQVGRGKSADV